MKTLLIHALDSAFESLKKQIPQTKKQIETISILDVNPLELKSFMDDNNIPDTAWFSGHDNGYDGWDDILLAWNIEVPTNENDKLLFCKKRFNDIAWRFVYDTLTKNGYKRVGYNTGLLKQFDRKTMYEMYIDKDFDMIEKYYSLPFIKE